MQKEKLDKDDNISWSAHFAHLQYSLHRPPAVSGLMQDNAYSLAMVKDGMEVIMKATEHLNPGQVPVITVNQPLYAIAKEIQWSWPEIYGEKKYAVLMGGLHIEMSVFLAIGWMEVVG